MTDSAQTSRPPADGAPTEPDPRRWWALAVLAAAGGAVVAA